MLIRQTLTYLPGAAAAPLFAFLTLIVFSRILTPEQYGRFALVIVTVELFKGGFFLWIKISLLRLFTAACEENALPDLLRTGYIALAVSGIAASIAYLATVYSGVFDTEYRFALLLGLPLLIAKAGAEQQLVLRSADTRPGVHSLMQIIQGSTGFFSAIVLVQFVVMDERGLLLGTLLGFTTIWLGDMANWRRRARDGILRPAILTNMASFGLPLSIATLLPFVVSFSDRYMLEYFMGPEAVGLYSVGYNLADRSIVSLFMLVSLAGLPLTLKVLEIDGIDAAKVQLRSNFNLIIALGCPAVVGIAMLAQPIANVFLGEDYRQAATSIMPLIAVSAFLAGFKTFYLDHAFHLGKRSGLLFLSALPPAIINVLANIIFIPIYGIHGAVYATILAYVIAALLSLFLGRRIFTLPISFPTFLKSAFASAVMAAALAAITMPDNGFGLLMAVACGSIVFAAMAFAVDLGGVRRKIFQ